MNLGDQTSRIRFQQWIKPGEHQSIEELVESLKAKGVEVLALEDGLILICDEGGARSDA